MAESDFMLFLVLPKVIISTMPSDFVASLINLKKKNFATRYTL